MNWLYLPILTCHCDLGHPNSVLPIIVDISWYSLSTGLVALTLVLLFVLLCPLHMLHMEALDLWVVSIPLFWLS